MGMLIIVILTSGEISKVAYAVSLKHSNSVENGEQFNIRIRRSPILPMLKDSPIIQLINSKINGIKSLFKPRRRPTKRPRYTTTQPTTAQSYNTYKYTTTAASAPTASYYYKYPTVKYHTTASPGPTISYYYKDVAVDSHSSSTSSSTVSTEHTTGTTTENTSTKSPRKGKRISLTNINDLNEDMGELMPELEMMNVTTTTPPTNTTSTTTTTNTATTVQTSKSTTTTTTAISTTTSPTTTTTSPTTTTTQTIPTPSPFYFKQFPTSSTTAAIQTILTPSPIFFKQFNVVAEQPPILPLAALAAVTEKVTGSALPSSNNVQSSQGVIKDIEADKKRNRMAFSQLNNEIQSLQIELQRLRDSRTKSARKGKTISSENINDLNDDIEELMSEVKMMKASFRKPKVLPMDQATLPSISSAPAPSPVEFQVDNFPAPPANSFNVASPNFPEPPVHSFHGANPNFHAPPVNAFDVSNPLYFEHVSENHGYQGQINPFHQSSQLHALQISHNPVPRPQGSYSYIQHGHSRTPIYHGLPRYR